MLNRPYVWATEASARRSRAWVLPPPQSQLDSKYNMVMYIYIALNRTPVTGLGQYPRCRV